MAGTPWRAVHFSEESAERTALAEKVGLANTIVAPWVMQARRPRTSPKQWNSGGGQQRMSEGVNDIRSPIELALFMRLLFFISKIVFRRRE